ncbi:MAG: response regulator [Myxococcota bacterium]
MLEERAKRVLVVEDDKDIRESLDFLLTSEGYAVSTAPDGATALQWLTGNPPPCVVILDLMMPRMSGWELCAAMAADPRLRDIPVLVITASGTNVVADLPRHMVRAVLTKPIDVDKLMDVVATACPGAGR